MIKAVFFDVDGTLVPFQNDRIPEDTLHALHRLRAQGIRLFLATGRHMCMLDEVLEQFDFDGYVTVSGQYCTCSGQVVHRNPIPRAGVEELVAAAEQGGFSCFFLAGEEMYLNRDDAAARGFLNEFHLKMPPIRHPGRALEEEIYQVIVMLDRTHEALLLERAAHLKTTRWHPTFLDALPPDGGKESGIGAVLGHLGLSAEQAMAFGDGENDITMLDYVGLGVAMGNANHKVKQRADYVTDAVDHGGVAAALKHFGLL